MFHVPHPGRPAACAVGIARYGRREPMQLFVAASIAAAMTAIYAFRYARSRSPWALLPYFLVFGALEWLGERYVIGPGVLGVEVAAVALLITTLFVVAHVGPSLSRGFERASVPTGTRAPGGRE